MEEFNISLLYGQRGLNSATRHLKTWTTLYLLQNHVEETVEVLCDTLSIQLIRLTLILLQYKQWYFKKLDNDSKEIWKLSILHLLKLYFSGQLKAFRAVNRRQIFWKEGEGVQYWPQMVKIVHCRLEFDKLNPVSAQQVFTYDTASSKPTEFHELKHFNKDNVFTEFLCRLV